MVFQNLVVLDLSQVFAGPLVTRVFAEFGATVIKVERPTGDISRQLPWRLGGRSGYFTQQNRGKLGVSADLRTDAGRQLLWDLIGHADVLVDGFAPGVLAGFGFSRQAMFARNERLVLCELSAVGRSGALGGLRGYDAIGASFSGVAYTSSTVDHPPAMPSVAMGDAMMGLCAYGGILTALYDRERTGKGQLVDVSLVDAYIQSHSNNLENFSLSGGKTDARRISGHNASVCPSGVWSAPGGKWIYIVALSNEEWGRIARCIGRPELAASPDFATNEARVAHRDAVVALLQEWIDSCGDRDTAVDLFIASGVPAAPVLSIGEVISHPHLLERGSVEIVTDEVLGSFAVPGPPFRLSAAQRTALAPAPALGEHNQTAVAIAAAVRTAV
jgi:CoA:oxalate CoA-transferase